MATFRTLRDPIPLQRARQLRRDDTDAEARLWDALRARRLGGWKWRRQVPKGRYIVDFLCVEAALVVELDGGQHSDQADYDARRTAYLEGLGLRVLRFWNFAVMENRDGVCLTILDACGGDRPNASPPREAERGEGRERGDAGLSVAAPGSAMTHGRRAFAPPSGEKE
jgi:very-short-patch-repair endonuclease